jgi:hypothetical protein
MTEAQLLASPFYRQIMKPDGVRHLAAPLFWSDDTRFITHIGLNRSAFLGPFTRAERALLEQLHPHLSLAIQRVRHLDSRRRSFTCFSGPSIIPWKASSSSIPGTK